METGVGGCEFVTVPDFRLDEGIQLAWLRSSPRFCFVERRR